MASGAHWSQGDRGGNGAIPRWVVAITVTLAALWAAYLLISGGERARGAAGDATPPGPAMSAGSSADAAALLGPTWVAEDIQSRGVIDYLQSYITFTADGQAHGFGGCNPFTGRYTLDGTTLGLGPLASTKKACPPAIMNQEARFHEALAETRAYRFENALLFLLDAQGASVMRLWRRD